VDWIVFIAIRLGLGASLVLPLTPVSAQTPLAAPLVVTAAGHGVSAPLRSLAEIAPASLGAPREIPEFVIPHSGPTGIQPQAIQADGALQAGAPLGQMPTPLENFDGLGNTSQVLPPDPDGSIGFDPATGKKYFVQWINLVYGVWDVTGTPTRLLGPISGQQIFAGLGPSSSCATNGQGDPLALYDSLAQRWLLSQFAFNIDLSGNPVGPYYQCIAISQTGDPTGAYYLYAFVWGNKLNDYSKLGVWSDAYYMSANQFSGVNFSGVGVAAFERAKMLVGDPSARMVYYDVGAANSTFSSMLPADFEGDAAPPAGAPEPFIEVDADQQMRLWNFTANWANPSTSSFGQSLAPTQQLPVAAFRQLPCVAPAAASRNCIPQPGGAPLLDGVADRVMNRLVYHNFGDHQSLVVNHTVWVDGTDRAGIRWYELRSTGGNWSIFQQGTYAPADGSYRWMASADMDRNGNLALGYSVSGPALNPSIRFAGRLAGDPIGTLGQAESSIIEGGGAQLSTSGRWGDYSMLTVDPQDGCTFWYTQEYYPASSVSNWMTRIASFRFPSCGVSATISGVVRDGTAGGHTWPLYARLDFASQAGTTTIYSDPASGVFQVTLSAGTYTAKVAAVASGYQAASFGFSVQAGAGPFNFPLQAAPTPCSAPGYQKGTGSACVAQPGGLLSGNVKDANTGAPLNGATVSLGASTATTISVPSDPGQPGGFYTLFGPAGPQTPTAAMSGGYHPQTLPVTLAADATTHQDFALTAGKLSSALALVSAVIGQNGTGIWPLDLTNSGASPVHYTLAISPATIKWLSTSAPSGTIAPGASQTVPLHVIAQGMAKGLYLATITITTDTPYPPLQVPVTLAVGDSTYLPVIGR
jgi:hypothetical protein